MEFAELSKSQIKHGYNLIKETSERWNVDKKTAIKILSDVNWIRERWQWVNMDIFLNGLDR